MAFALYDVLLLLVAVGLVPWYLLRRAFGLRSRSGLRERFGWYAPQRLTAIKGRPVIWIHAVSVGETRAAIPLIKGLRQAWPDHALVLTNVTETGHEVATTIVELDLCLFFPLDLSFVIRRVLDRLQPTLIVIVETEIWPQLIRTAAQRNIPLALVNGRISDRSYPRYRRFKGMLAPVLKQVRLFCMQSDLDCQRIVALGADPESAVSSGNLKFDMPMNQAEADSARLRSRYRLPDSLPLWICGSTHDGEETALLQCYRSLLEQGAELALILVPRHPPRVPAVCELLSAANFHYRRRSQLTTESPLLAKGEVLLVDTLGELLSLYAASDVVFVGGSLVPVGGHNLLEAALVSRPVIFGPYMHNFREIARLILSAGAGSQVQTAQELPELLIRYLQNPQWGEQQGAAGEKLVAAHAGATIRTIGLLQALVRG
ncbi:MAG: 3-deoxy-D-manno-octulosonic acid transferase [Desulfuromonadales bacterium]|nr:3-deoxy-D-manno-octulosonic acid transferase [Desulfuromonadales bacterium]